MTEGAFAVQKRLLQKWPEPIIFDCGANVGQTTAKYLGLFPEATIYAFEPNPETYTLAYNIHANNSRVVLEQLAIGSANGTLELNLGNDHCTASLLLQNSTLSVAQQGGAWFFDRKLPVAVATIDGICERRQIQQLHLLKMDLQGYELEALKGADQMLRQKRISVIYTEVLLAPLYVGAPLYADITQHLAAYGYALHSFYPVHSSWGDAIFTSTSS